MPPPADALGMLDDLAAGMAGRGLAETEDLVTRARALAGQVKVAQAAMLLKQAADQLGRPASSD